MKLIKTLIARRSQFQQPVVLFRADIVIEIVHGIDGVAIAVDLIMAVGAGAFAGAADPPDHFAANDLLTGLYLYPEHMAV